jgi:hypothetical protein
MLNMPPFFERVVVALLFRGFENDSDEVNKSAARP